LTFEQTLADALRDGFCGIRVAADNTSLIGSPEQLDAWLAWETVAEAFIDENPVTGLCSFDRTRLAAETLAAVSGAHSVQVPN
jgi:hypothetical protein